MITELALSELTDLAVNAAGIVVNKSKSTHDWKKLFVNTGKIFTEYENNADQIFDDLAVALSSQNMKELAEKLKSENGYELRRKLYDYILDLLRKYEIPEDVALSYTTGITNAILNEISVVAPDKYDRYFLNDWREEDKGYLQSLSAKIAKINTSLAEFNDRQLKVYSANAKDIELKRKTINPRIGIDFFEIDDDNFKSIFAERLQNNKICVRGRFVEETIYCILNELWRVRDPRAVFVVQSQEDWERLSQIPQNGNIYIPNFIADEIVPIESNTNIFIYTEDIPTFSNDIIDLRPRTYATIVHCLVRAGMDVNQANDFVAETHGLYVAMKKKLFNGQLLRQPKWLLELDNKIKKTCLLLGQWTECEGDTIIVENLSGIPYREFIDKLAPYSKGEDPFIHVINHRGQKTYYLSSVENTWEYYQVSVFEDIWKNFVELFFEVFNEHERIFTYNQKELITAQFKGEKLFWSSNIRKGMLKTLLIKAGYKKHEECQYYLDEIVERVLSHIDNVDKWKYISEFFIELCEIAPKVIIKRLFSEFETPTGLTSLFENQDSDFIMGKNHYINILFGVDELLVQKEYAVDAFVWLLKLDNQGFEYKSNSPIDTFTKVLCTWYNFSVFHKYSEKIRLAEIAFDYDKNAWDIIYKCLLSNNQAIAGTLHAPKYRECVQEDKTTYEELNKTAVGYIDILLKHMEFKPKRWIQLIKYSDDVDKNIRKKILDAFLFETTQMMDYEKIEIKNSIRKLIYRHRYFASASWAMPEKKLQIYENILSEINTSEPEYEFMYLFGARYESPLLHPVPYDEKDKRELNENAKAKLLSKKVAEFKEKEYDLSLLAQLCAAIDNSSLGQALAINWNGTVFDIKVFTILLNAQESGRMALDYYAGFGVQVTELFDTVMEIALELEVNMHVITGLYSIEAMCSKTIPRIAEAENDIKHDFWKNELICVKYNDKWALKECKEYGTLNSYLHLLYFIHYNNPISNEELYDYLDGIEKLKLNKNGDDIGYYIEELLKPLQNTYIEEPIKCIRIAAIEMIFFHFLEWDDMKCFKYSISKDPKVFVDLVSIIFKKDHNNTPKHSEEENDRISNLYSLYDKARFCPSECEGKVKEDELEMWIDKFKHMIEEQDQGSLFGMLLGRLFAFAPIGMDDHMPCEAVRAMIEKFSDDSLQRAYRLAVYNSRGVFSPSAGKKELQMAENFKANAEYLISIGYPRTAEIYYGLARTYYSESAREREDAENGIF